MHVLLIRHAKAAARESFAATGVPDASRPLTKKGARKFGEAAAGLRQLVDSIDVLASSPLKRALQTAQIVAGCYGGIPIAQARELAPESTAKTALAWLMTQEGRAVVAVVGHEPNLTELIALLLSEKSQSVRGMKKGTACLIEFPQHAAERAGNLVWARTRKQLAAQAD
jgi:phosphohistidine phosphatase